MPQVVGEYRILIDGDLVQAEGGRTYVKTLS